MFFTRHSSKEKKPDNIDDDIWEADGHEHRCKIYKKKKKLDDTTKVFIPDSIQERK